jgi:general stress protein 26
MTTTLLPRQIKQYAHEIIEASWPIVLTTVSAEGLPVSRAMTNLHNADRLPAQSKFFAEQGEWNLFFRTKRTTEKVKQIQHNARATVYCCDAPKMAGLDLIGRVEVVNDPRAKKILWRDDWECFFYGLDDPEFRLLKFHTESFRLFVRLPDVGFEKINMAIKDL